ncbi:MAG: NAD(P)H-dependent oxidoreductase [Nanoarchaeota archaeon]
MEIKDIIRNRYSCKKFDGRSIPEKQIEEIKEAIRLAPSSFGLQPYKVKITTDKQTKEKLLEASYNQEQITTCSHLLIFCAYTDINKRINQYEEMMLDSQIPQEKIESYINIMKQASKMMPNQIDWATKQAYIAMDHALLAATALEINSCPMEGFNSAQYSKILDLPKDLVPVLVVPLGYTADIPKPKIRYKKEELFF